jgi:hypothetical protein
MTKYKLEFSYNGKVNYDVYIEEDCSLTREEYLSETIKSIVDDELTMLECDNTEREWIRAIMGCINRSWKVEEYELTNESDGLEVNLVGTIQLTTQRKLSYDGDISDRLSTTMEIYFENEGYNIDEQYLYEKCHHLGTQFWLDVGIDTSTVKASAILKEID